MSKFDEMKASLRAMAAAHERGLSAELETEDGDPRLIRHMAHTSAGLRHVLDAADVWPAKEELQMPDVEDEEFASAAARRRRRSLWPGLPSPSPVAVVMA